MSYYSNQGGAGGGGGGYYGGGQQQQPPNASYGQQQQQGNFQYGDPNVWQQQQQQQQQYSQQQQQQQPQYNQQQQQQQQPQYNQQQQNYPPPQQQPAFWNPAAAATIAAMAMSAASGGGVVGGTSTDASSAAMFDMAGAAGKSFLQSSSARMIPGLEQAMGALRSYFAVDNRYVLYKMKRVLFPFTCKQWKRQIKDVAPSSDNVVPPLAYQLPMDDECAPDLYLPIMSGITYVLLSALLYGTAGQFNPEVIPSVTTQCFVTQVLEVAAIRLGFYLMQSQVAVLDLFSYTGYKYLGLCINMMAGIVFGHCFGFSAGARGYYVTFLWTATAASYCMLKTMANNIPIQTAPQGPKREVMVIAFAASQFATMWFVSQTKFL